MWENLQKEINHKWEEDILPVLNKYIAIPNKSPMFDPQWEGQFMAQATELLVSTACICSGLEDHHNQS